MAEALNELGNQQANPTEKTMAAVERFLGYAATWPNASIEYRPSNMKLIIESDASHLSVPLGRSRAGGHHRLQAVDEEVTGKPNGSIDIISKIIPNVTGSVAESEYAAMYINATIAEQRRDTLQEIGYPQEATEIFGDNQCAVGLANETHKQKMSKAVDHKFHWIRDRIKQQHFKATWRPGKTNLADYFTKAHPVGEHRERRRMYVVDVLE